MRTYVITGGGSFGETTMIEILASRGYAIVPEAARLVVEEERLKGSETVPEKNMAAFQKLVAKKQIELEMRAQGAVVFLDRGLIDGAAYCRERGIALPEEVEAFGRNRYDGVFALESLGIYVYDGTRRRSLEQSKKTHAFILEAYKDFGYDPVLVPALPPLERVEFIESRIKAAV